MGSKAGTRSRHLWFCRRVRYRPLSHPRWIDKKCICRLAITVFYSLSLHELNICLFYHRFICHWQMWIHSASFDAKVNLWKVPFWRKQARQSGTLRQYSTGSLHRGNRLSSKYASSVDLFSILFNGQSLTHIGNFVLDYLGRERCSTVEDSKRKKQ